MGKHKTPSPDLFHLVQSLSKGERRNLKLLAKVVARGGSKRYMELFDMLAGHDGDRVPDEAALAARFGDQLPNLKHYLHGLILRSLSHFADSPQAALSALREQARILIEKGLESQAMKLLERGIAEAQAHAWWEELAAMLALRAQLAGHAGQAAIWRQVEEVRAWHQQDSILQLLLAQVVEATGSGTWPPGSAAREALAGEVLGHPAMQDGSAMPMRARMLQWRIRLALEDGTRSDAWHRAVAAITELYASGHPALVQPAHGRLAHLVLLAEAKACAGDLRGAEDGMALVEAQTAVGKTDWQLEALLAGLRISIATYSQNAGQLMRTADDMAAEAMHLLPRLDAGARVALCLTLARGHLLSGQARVALAWARRAREVEEERTHHAVRLQVRMLAIMARVDVGDHALAEAELRSLKRLLAKRGAMTVHERFFFKAIRKLCRVMQEGENPGAAAERLLARYETLLTDVQAAAHADRPLQFWAWLRAITDGQPPCAFTWEGLARVQT